MASLSGLGFSKNGDAVSGIRYEIVHGICTISFTSVRTKANSVVVIDGIGGNWSIFPKPLHVETNRYVVLIGQGTNFSAGYIGIQEKQIYMYVKTGISYVFGSLCYAVDLDA